jgi:transposase-like protein
MMTTKKTAVNYSPEVLERAARMVLEGGGDRPTQWAAINSVAAMIGCITETLRKWVRQANEILRKASAYFAQAELDCRSRT